MSRYHDEAGRATSPDDPRRLMWYSTRCSYWTDDWTELKLLGQRIPCCPTCQAVGYQSPFEAFEFMLQSKETSKQLPGFAAYVLEHKEICQVPAFPAPA